MRHAREAAPVHLHDLVAGLNAVVARHGRLVHAGHVDAEAVLEAAADHQPEIVPGTEVEGDLKLTL